MSVNCSGIGVDDTALDLQEGNTENIAIVIKDEQVSACFLGP
jgi:hypothetical protein